MATLGKSMAEARAILMAYGAELARICDELGLGGCDLAADVADPEERFVTFRGYNNDDDTMLSFRVDIPSREVVA